MKTSPIEKINNWESRKTEIKTRVDFLIKNCFLEKDFYKLYEQMNSFSGKLAEYQKLRNEFEKTALFVNTLPELKYALELTHPLEQRTTTLAHENAHANMAEILGGKHLHYIVGFFKDKSGNILASPSSSHFIPEEWPEEKRLEAATRIIVAPELYGEELSEDDKAQIKRNMDLLGE